MTPNQIQILQHSLGLDQFGQGRQYRNHYVGDPETCRPLVELGYMREHPASQLTGDDPLFTVTDAGKEAVRTESPQPPPAPKLTRSQKRYRKFLEADTGYSFREWMGFQRKQRAQF